MQEGVELLQVNRIAVPNFLFLLNCKCFSFCRGSRHFFNWQFSRDLLFLNQPLTPNYSFFLIYVDISAGCVTCHIELASVGFFVRFFQFFDCQANFYFKTHTCLFIRLSKLNRSSIRSENFIVELEIFKESKILRRNAYYSAVLDLCPFKFEKMLIFNSKMTPFFHDFRNNLEISWDIP